VGRMSWPLTQDPFTVVWRSISLVAYGLPRDHLDWIIGLDGFRRHTVLKIRDDRRPKEISPAERMSIWGTLSDAAPGSRAFRSTGFQLWLRTVQDLCPQLGGVGCDGAGIGCAVHDPVVAFYLGVERVGRPSRVAGEGPHFLY
jgi:hypothetical protein